MVKYYVRYKKLDRLKYISHLDFMRSLNRTMRRASLPVSYSEGFNPHPVLSFPLPLPTFYTSECEIVDIAFETNLSEEFILNALNENAPKGLEFFKAYEHTGKIKDISFAVYKVTPEKMPVSIDDFLSKKSIIIPKKTKSGIKETEIRDDIIDIKIVDNSMLFTLSAGSVRNLKPDTVISAMNKYIKNFDSGDCEYLRLKILDKDMNEI